MANSLDWAKLRGKSLKEKITKLSSHGILFAEKVFHRNKKACRFATMSDGSFSCKGYKIQLKGKKKTETIEKYFTSNSQKTTKEFNLFIKYLIKATPGSSLSLLGTIGGKRTGLALSKLKKTDEFGGQAAGGKKVNKGIQFEKDLHTRFIQCLGGKLCKGKYESQAESILTYLEEQIGHSPSTAEWAGPANTSRPLEGASGNIYIAPNSHERHGEKLTDITLKFPKASDVHLSLKFGKALTFMNAGSKTFLPISQIDAGEITTNLGIALFELFGINNKKFCKIWAKKKPLRGHKEEAIVNRANVKKFLRTAIGSGYWMVHGNEPLGTGNIDFYEMSASANSTASSLVGDKVEIFYGGRSKAGGKRLDVDFSSKSFDFSLNIRSKSSKTSYPTNVMLDYKTLDIVGKQLLTN